MFILHSFYTDDIEQPSEILRCGTQEHAYNVAHAEASMDDVDYVLVYRETEDGIDLVNEFFG